MILEYEVASGASRMGTAALLALTADCTAPATPEAKATTRARPPPLLASKGRSGRCLKPPAAHRQAHERHPDFPKDVCKAKSIGAVQPPLDWDAMTVTIVAPAPNRGGGGRNANGKREREDDGAKLGIYTSADGKRVVWGNCVTDFDTAPDLKAHCPARFAPAGSTHSWCPTPGLCWERGGESAHERHPDFPKDVCKAKSIGTVQPPLDWNAMTVTIVAPAPIRGGGGRNANGKREREDDGQRQGRGKGKGAGKGKGKGGGRNGGKGGGRGFQRQPR
jgi:hypothetical protein